jgi:hypothetical protein
VLHYGDKNGQTCATCQLHELYKNHVIKGFDILTAVALHQLHPAAIAFIVVGCIVNQSLGWFLFDPRECDQRHD